jgi:UDP-2,4-diacetamido-2,4,6-trideoxy-beta-L-altropyranose hydrolase
VNIAFRVDSSAAMGVGHIMRCLTLARAVRQRGGAALFICREHEGHQMAAVARAGLPVRALPAPPGAVPERHDRYAQWLGVTQEQDAEQTVETLADAVPDWLLLDHYGLDVSWERRVRPLLHRLLVIDDLANREHDCEMLLDQNFLPERPERYSRLVPGRCQQLLGPRFALVRPEYAQRAIGSAPPARKARVFVFFGGSDPDDLTGGAVQALSHPSLRHVEVDVVVGANYRHGAQLRRLVSSRPGMALHSQLPHLAGLMRCADLAIGAAGTTTWERLCAGLPSLVLTIADNQVPGAQALAQQGLIQYLGPATDVGSADLTAAIRSALEDRAALAEQSLRGRLLVDGLGAERVLECLEPTDRRRLRLRAARADDVELYFTWANDAEVRQHSLNEAAISWETHQQWFQTRLADSLSHLFVLEAGPLPVGQVRFDGSGDTWRIDYSIDVAFRGRGWGRTLLLLGMRRVAERQRTRFCAEVKRSNGASAAHFVRLGFTATATERADLEAYHFDSGQHALPEMD